MDDLLASFSPDPPSMLQTSHLSLKSTDRTVSASSTASTIIVPQTHPQEASLGSHHSKIAVSAAQFLQSNGIMTETALDRPASLADRSVLRLRGNGRSSDPSPHSDASASEDLVDDLTHTTKSSPTTEGAHVDNDRPTLESGRYRHPVMFSKRFKDSTETDINTPSNTSHKHAITTEDDAPFAKKAFVATSSSAHAHSTIHETSFSSISRSDSPASTSETGPSDSISEKASSALASEAFLSSSKIKPLDAATASAQFNTSDRAVGESKIPKGPKKPAEVSGEASLDLPIINTLQFGEAFASARAITDKDNEFQALNTRCKALQDLNRDLKLETTQQAEEIARLRMQITATQPTEHSDSTTSAVERSLFEARQAMNESPFVCVIIDATNFELLKSFLPGNRPNQYFLAGLEVAGFITKDVRTCLDPVKEARTWKVVVTVFADLNRLCSVNDVESQHRVHEFAHGFNAGGGMHNLVDVRSQDIIIRKVLATVTLMENNRHCRRIILGCDNHKDYVEHLSAVALNPLISANFTLLENSKRGALFQPHEVRSFDVTSFSNVFECATPFQPLSNTDSRLIDEIEPIESQASVSGLNQHAEPSLLLDQIPVLSAESQKESIRHWALNASQNVNRRPSAASTEVSTPALTPVPPGMEKSVHKEQDLDDHIARDGNWWVDSNKVHLNINNQRIDCKLPASNDRAFSKFTFMEDHQRPCVTTYLTGACNSSGKCVYLHPDSGNPDPRRRNDLSYQDLVTLKHWSRRLRCFAGLACRKPKCVHGHNCYVDGCVSPRCVFADSHGIPRDVITIL